MLGVRRKTMESIKSKTTKKYEPQCPYCGVSYSHSSDCKRNALEVLLSDAMDCLNGETPEDISKAEAKRRTVSRIQLWLRYGEVG